MMFLVALAIAVIAFFVARKLAVGTDDPMRAAAIAGARRFLTGVAIVALIGALTQLVRVIPAGHVGVIDLFGVVKGESLKSGIHIVNPLARVIPMSIQTQEMKEVMEVPSKEGLTMQLEVSALFHLDPEKAPGIREIRGLIRAKGIVANLVYSRGQYLDLLPERASKGRALKYLSEKWGIPMEHVLVAGDSGNDAEMLASRALGVVVGNHSSELDHLRGLDRVYFAEGEYAWGIIEGIDHYQFFAESE